MCGCVVLFYLICTPFNIWRMTVGPVSGSAFWFWVFTANFTIFFVFLGSYEYIALKFLTVVIFGKIISVVDDFSSSFLFLTNVVIGSMLGILNLYTAEGMRNHYRNAGLPIGMAPASSRLDLQ